MQRWAVGLLVLSTISCQAALIEPEATEVPAASEAPVPSPSPPPAPEREVCDGTQLGSIQQVIIEQAQALTAGDWEGAYGFASPAFRAAVTQDQFVQVIVGQYDMLLSFESAQFGRCEALGSRAARLSVEIVSGVYQPVIMVYELVTSDGLWFVNGVDVPISAVPNA